MRSCIISNVAVGAFFLVGVSIIAASLFICPSLCFFEIVCILCAHTRAAYVILGLITTVNIHFTSFGRGPQYLLCWAHIQ